MLETTRDERQAFEIRSQRSSKNATSPKERHGVFKHKKTKASGTSGTGMTSLAFGTEPDLEWYRLQVSGRFLIKLRGYLVPGGHHKREMRIPSRLLAWHASHCGRAGMITCEGDQRHADLLLTGTGLDHGKSRGKTTPWNKPTVLAKHPLAGAYLLAAQNENSRGTCSLPWSGQTSSSPAKRSAEGWHNKLSLQTKP